jgi:hypothetical protein
MARIPAHTVDDAPAAARPLGLTVFTSYFLNCAATELGVPAGPAHTGEDVPASPALPGGGA